MPANGGGEQHSEGVSWMGGAFFSAWEAFLLLAQCRSGLGRLLELMELTKWYVPSGSPLSSIPLHPQLAHKAERVQCLELVCCYRFNQCLNRVASLTSQLCVTENLPLSDGLWEDWLIVESRCRLLKASHTWPAGR